MKFSDIIALAKAGYKPSEVKELMAMTDNQPDGAEEPAEIPEKAPVQPEQEKASEKPAEDPVKPDNIAEMQKQIDNLKKQLLEAQKKNTKSDISGGVPDPGKTLEDIARRFM